VIEEGKPAPDFELKSDDGETVKLSSLRGKPVVLYFYPKDDTPGCTKQACGLRDVMPKVGDTVVLGISPDKPAKQKKFDDKYSLGFPLLADEDHKVAEEFDVWTEKSMYGRKYMGMERATYLIGSDGKVVRAWRKVKVPGHAQEVLKAAAQV